MIRANPLKIRSRYEAGQLWNLYLNINEATDKKLRDLPPRHFQKNQWELGGEMAPPQYEKGKRTLYKNS